MLPDNLVCGFDLSRDMITASPLTTLPDPSTRTELRATCWSSCSPSSRRSTTSMTRCSMQSSATSSIHQRHVDKTASITRLLTTPTTVIKHSRLLSRRPAHQEQRRHHREVRPPGQSSQPLCTAISFNFLSISLACLGPAMGHRAVLRTRRLTSFSSLMPWHPPYSVAFSRSSRTC